MSIENSRGVNEENSKGVKVSSGVNRSKGVNCSNGVNKSEAVNWSSGVNWSGGVNRSSGVNRSYGVLNSYGVDNAIFLANKPQTYSIFGVEVPEQRFNEVWNQLHVKLNGWFPKFNNAFELYVQNGGSWKKVDESKISSTLDDWEKPYEAWKDMPQEAIEYVKSLPEFDAEMFKTITGIDVKKTSRRNDTGGSV